MSDEERRHSVASEANLILDEQQRAEAEARNGLVQFDRACSMIVDAIEKEKAGSFVLPPSLRFIGRLLRASAAMPATTALREWPSPEVNTSPSMRIVSRNSSRIFATT
ncbi:MAG TPA: hypothetical protein VK181_25180 [Rhizobium sp.]|nr:hypothetical protein [Rhizobium sp.]